MIRLLYFTAEWCSPCRKFGPSLQQEAGALGLELHHVDIDANPGLAQAHSVMSVPTVIAVRAGAQIDRFGYLSPAALRERLQQIA